VDAQQHERDGDREAQSDALNRASQERIAGIKEQTERIRLAAEEARAQREHAHTVAQSILNRQQHVEDAAAAQSNDTQDRQERAEARQFGGPQL